MRLKNHIREAIRNLYSTKLRSFLAALGILVGTASVVAMVSGGELATYQALQQFKTLGTNLLAISLNTVSSKDDEKSSDVEKGKLPLRAALHVQSVSSDILKTAPYINIYSPIKFNGQPIQGNIVGATEDLFSIMKIELQQGRFVREFDQYSAYCTIGYTIYEQLKKYTLSPIGQQIQLGKHIFTIIGVNKPWEENSFVYANLNESIFIPIPMASLLDKYSDIYNIVLRVNPDTKLPELQNKITTYFKNNAKNKQLYFRSAQQIIDNMAKQKQILTTFLAFIGSISLLVGGIGIMNIMLVSVTERRQEIGIRLAVGAKRRDIQIMFLIESVMLSLFGGIVGVILGILIALAIAELKHWQFMIFLFPIVAGFLVSVFSGIFFGFYPAYKASQLDPIQTLRTE